jgi:mRNA interferase MazF
MGEPRGSEPGYRRPVVIVSTNEFNRSLIQTVIVAVVTSNLRLVYAPGNFKITQRQSNLSKDSVVNVSQLITLDKTFLTEKIGKLDTLHIPRKVVNSSALKKTFGHKNTFRIS